MGAQHRYTSTIFQAVTATCVEYGKAIFNPHEPSFNREPEPQKQATGRVLKSIFRQFHRFTERQIIHSFDVYDESQNTDSN